jgi:hypothetical protein
MQPIHHSASRPMQLGIPVYDIEAFGRRTVPHGGFATVQNDIATRALPGRYPNMAVKHET